MSRSVSRNTAKYHEDLQKILLSLEKRLSAATGADVTRVFCRTGIPCMEATGEMAENLLYYTTDPASEQFADRVSAAARTGAEAFYAVSTAATVKGEKDLRYYVRTWQGILFPAIRSLSRLPTDALPDPAFAEEMALWLPTLAAWGNATAGYAISPAAAAICEEMQKGLPPLTAEAKVRCRPE